MILRYLEYVEVEFAVPEIANPLLHWSNIPLQSSISNSPSMAVTGKVNLSFRMEVSPFHLTPQNHTFHQPKGEWSTCGICGFPSFQQPPAGDFPTKTQLGRTQVAGAPDGVLAAFDCQGPAGHSHGFRSEVPWSHMGLPQVLPHLDASLGVLPAQQIHLDVENWEKISPEIPPHSKLICRVWYVIPNNSAILLVKAQPFSAALGRLCSVWPTLAFTKAEGLGGLSLGQVDHMIYHP